MKKNLLLAVCMSGVMVSFVSEAFGQSLPVYDLSLIHICI